MALMGDVAGRLVWSVDRRACLGWVGGRGQVGRGGGATQPAPKGAGQGGPSRCPELEAGAGSREGAVLLCQGQRLLPEGALTLIRAACLPRRFPTSQREDHLQVALPKVGGEGLHPDADLGSALTSITVWGVEFGIPTEPHFLPP